MKAFYRLKESVRSLFVNNQLPSKDEAFTLEMFQAFSDRFGLSDVMPYESYDSLDRLYYNTDTAGFMLYGYPSTGLVENDLKVLNGLFNTNYPEGTVIQVSIISDSNIEGIVENWANNKANPVDDNNTEIFKFLANNRVELFKSGKWKSLIENQPYILRNYHLIVTMTVPTNKFADGLPEEEIARLKRVRENFRSTMGSAKIPTKILEPDHFLNIMNGFLNPSSKPQPFIEYDENNLLRHQIMSGETMVQIAASGANVVHKDEEYCLLPFNVRQYPRTWAGVRNGELIGSLQDDIKRIGCPFIATLSVYVPDQTSTKNQAVTNSTRATQMSDSPIAKYLPQWVDRKRDWQYTVDELDGGNKLLESTYQVILLSEKGKENSAEEGLISQYNSLGWVLARSRYTVLHSLINALPMGASTEVIKAMKVFKYYRRMLSNNCTNVAPWVAEYKGSNSPLMMFIGKRGQINYFDPFANKKGNYNVAVTATSGSGKSFIVQDLAYSILGGGGRAFIIDSGHSYRNLCKLLNGTYIDFGDKSQTLCFNPFTNINPSNDLIVIDDKDLPKESAQAVTHFEEQLPMLKKLIMQMASGGEEEINRKQQAFIERAIQKAWAEKKNEACIDDVINYLKNDEDRENPDDMTGKDLAEMMYSWSKKGMYSEYVNGKNNIDLDKTFVVLDLDGLKDTKDLQGVALLMLMMKITQTMYITSDKAQRKLCIIDEAWKLMSNGKSAAETIEEGYRVARKHGGSFVAITQSIGDFYKSDTAQAALVNADFEIHLRQKDGALANAISKGYIDDSDGKVQILKRLVTVQGQYSDVAVISPDGISVNRLLVDKRTQKIYSTSPEEVGYLKQQQANGASILQAVDALIEHDEQRRLAS